MFELLTRAEKKVLKSDSEDSINSLLEMNNIIENHNVDLNHINRKSTETVYLQLPDNIALGKHKKSTHKTLNLSVNLINFKLKKELKSKNFSFIFRLDRVDGAESLLEKILARIMPDDAEEEDYIISNFRIFHGSFDAMTKQTAKILTDKILEDIQNAEEKPSVTIFSAKGVRFQKPLHAIEVPELTTNSEDQQLSSEDSVSMETPKKLGNSEVFEKLSVEDWKGRKHKIEINGEKNLFDVLGIISSKELFSLAGEYDHSSFYYSEVFSKEGRIPEPTKINKLKNKKVYLLRNTYRIVNTKITVYHNQIFINFYFRTDATVMDIIKKACNEFPKILNKRPKKELKEYINGKLEYVARYFYLSYKGDFEKRQLELNKTINDLSSYSFTLTKKPFEDKLKEVDPSSPAVADLNIKSSDLEKEDSIKHKKKSFKTESFSRARKFSFNLKRLTNIGSASHETFNSISIEDVMGETIIELLNTEKKNRIKINLEEVTSVSKKSKKSLVLQLQNKKLSFECHEETEADRITKMLRDKKSKL